MDAPTAPRWPKKSAADDVLAACQFLAAQPFVDAQRIGVMRKIAGSENCGVKSCILMFRIRPRAGISVSVRHIDCSANRCGILFSISLVVK